MAKGQKRSNREVKKPKANKPPAASAGSPKGLLAPTAVPKKKG